MDITKKFLEVGEPEAALERLKKLLKTGSAAEWRIHELIGAAFHDLCDAEGVVQASFSAVMTDKYLRSQRTHFSNYLFALHYLPQLDASILTNELAVYNSLYRDTKKFILKKNVGAKISVAYIAPNFCDSSAARFYEALLTDYDRDKFSVTVWSLSKEEDSFTQRISHSVDTYFEIAETSFEESAKKIRDLSIDILIDLGGHTEGGPTLQIMAYKPARIQISGIGYFDSTGLEAIDYFIGDEFLTAHTSLFTEKILPLERAFAFRPNEKMIRAKKSRRAFPHKNFTFGSLNNFMKLSDTYLAAVKKILDIVPTAEIIFRDTTPLKSRQFSLVERLKNFGIERARVLRGENDFFADYNEIDLILDSFPYPGGMMTALALYMGVPVLNLCGELPHTRTGADILRIADLDELIVRDVDTYIKKAVELAKNQRQLAALTAKISLDKLTKLTDTKSFVSNFYKSLEAI